MPASYADLVRQLYDAEREMASLKRLNNDLVASNRAVRDWLKAVAFDRRGVFRVSRQAYEDAKRFAEIEIKVDPETGDYLIVAHMEAKR